MSALDSKVQNSEIWIRNNQLVNISDDFVHSFGHDRETLMGASTDKATELLRSDIFCRTIDNGHMVEEFLFTKNLKPRHVMVGMYRLADRETKVYYIQKSPDVEFEQKFQFIEIVLEQNATGVGVIKYPEGKLLRANEKFAKHGFFRRHSVEQLIGKSCDWTEGACIIDEDRRKLHDHIHNKRTTFAGSINTITEDGNTERFDLTLIPVYEENMLKYLIVMYKPDDSMNKARMANLMNKANSDKLMKFINVPTVKFTYPDMEILSLDFGNANEVFDHGKLNLGSDMKMNEQMIKCLKEIIQSPEYKPYLDEMIATKSIVETGTKEIMMMNKAHAVSLIFRPNLDTSSNVCEFSVCLIDKNHNAANAAMKEEAQRGNTSEFLSYMAHEMKAPLTVIHSAIQLIDFFCHEELSEKADRFINKIRQSSMQQLRLVNNFLDINKMDSGYLKLNKSNVDIVMMTGAIVNEASLISERKQVSMVFISELSSRIISIDDEKYERILLNILSNAIKFTPAGKSIQVKLFVESGCVKIGVKDEGVGIPEEKQKLVFEKFGQVGSSLTRQGEGTGLGLCLAKMLAKAHGGDVLLQSKVGEGSEFIIVLPDVFEKTETDQESAAAAAQAVQEDRLIQSVKVEFSNIYL